MENINFRRNFNPNMPSSPNNFDPNMPLIPRATFPITDITRQRIAGWQYYRSGYATPYYLIADPDSESSVFFGTSIDGFPIGRKAEYYGHVAVFGASGEGKTTSIAVPTLHTWKGSIFAFDIKGGATRS